MNGTTELLGFGDNVQVTQIDGCGGIDRWTAEVLRVSDVGIRVKSSDSAEYVVPWTSIVDLKML